MLCSNHTFIILSWHGHIILTLQKYCLSHKKGLRIMFFLRRDAHTNPLFKNCNILKYHDKIPLENSILIHKSFKHELFQPFNSWFGLSSNFHTRNKGWSNLCCLNVPCDRTKLYGRKSVFNR